MVSKKLPDFKCKCFPHDCCIVFYKTIFIFFAGQFYVIGSPQEVFSNSQVQRSLAPRLSSSLDGGPRAVRVS